MPAVALPPKPARLVLAPYQSAEWICRGLDRQTRIVAMTKGHLSMADMMIAIADVTGPADVMLSAWGIVLDDIALLRSAVESGKIRSVRLLSEYSFGNETAKIDAARAAFGEDSVSLSATHAKIATVTNETWQIAYRGSANMERHLVFEQIEIEHSPQICALMLAYAAAPQLTSSYPKPAAEPGLAQASIAPLVTGARVFGITEGFSLTALVEAVLALTGPADVDVLAWRVGAKDAARLRANSNARSLRVIMSQAFTTLSPGAGRETAGLLGTRCRLALNHAKVVTIRNDAWSLTIRSSMNLNRNPRAEHFDIDADPAVAAFFTTFFESLWTTSPANFTPSSANLATAFRNAMGGGMADESRYDSAKGLETKLRTGPIRLAREAPTPIRLRREPPAARPLPQLSLALPQPFAAAKSALPRA